MKRTVLFARLSLAALCVALLAAPALYAKDDAAPQKAEAEWREIFAGDEKYLDSYNNIKAPEETFCGKLTFEEEENPSILMRYTPYKLNGAGVYTGSNDLKEYVGREVEIVGKKNSFELEGQVVTEIWPVKIRFRAQEEQAKPVEQSEVPAKPVNGLLFEIKLPDAHPLYPGDTTLEVEYRMTNVGEKGEIQFINYDGCFGSEFLYAKIVGPDGKGIALPAVLVDMAPPSRATCTLGPGCFYGMKQRISLPVDLKPGRYALALHYGNTFDLKDKGFNCWTGEIESNTIAFEVADADVKPVNDIQMFIRMTKEKYAADEPVTVEVRFFNASDSEKDIYVPDAHLLNYYSQGSVTDANGKVADWLRIIFVRAPDVKYEKLAPGKAFVKVYDLRAVCELPPGEYTFRLTSGIPWKEAVDKGGSLVSNEVRFEIVKSEISADTE